MNPHFPCEPARSCGAAFAPWLAGPPPVSLLPKRTTVVRKKKLEKRRRQTDNSNAHDFPPPDHKVKTEIETETEDDSVIGEADRPATPLDKPEA